MSLPMWTTHFAESAVQPHQRNGPAHVPANDFWLHFGDFGMSHCYLQLTLSDRRRLYQMRERKLPLVRCPPPFEELKLLALKPFNCSSDGLAQNGPP